MLESFKDYSSRYSVIRGISDNILYAVSGHGWAIGYYAGAWVEVLSGVAIGEKRKIISNTDRALTLESPFTITPILTQNVLGKTMPVNNRYKIYWDWTAEEAADFNNLTITGSCFGRQTLRNDLVIMKDMFPVAMTGTSFIRCNLDNVVVPGGNPMLTSDDGIITSNRKMKEQNDCEHWVLDGADKPIEPVNKKIYEKLGISTDPVNIPAEALEKSIIVTTKEA